MGATLADIVAALGGELHGDGGLQVDRIAPLAVAQGQDITFLANLRWRASLATSAAACVIVSPDMRQEAVARGAAIVTPDPYAYYARLTQWWAARKRPAAQGGVHPTATVHPRASVDATARIEAHAVVEEDARVEAHAVVGAHGYVGAGARLGKDSRLAARVVLGAGCSIGERAVVHPGAVIGADGFGFAPIGQGDAKRWCKIEQLGAVTIGDDVEIGANTCIDRGALGDTVIEDGVKLDNLIQIGHNVRIGAHTAMAGCAGVAGSTTIGRHCMIGGAANIIGHLEIADHVTVSVATVITRSIREAGHYSGIFPFDDNAQWERNAATLRQLHALRERIRELERHLKNPTDEGRKPT